MRDFTLEKYQELARAVLGGECASLMVRGASGPTIRIMPEEKDH